MKRAFLFASVLAVYTSSAGYGAVDTKSNQVGRLTSFGGASSRTFNQYDANGRVTATQYLQDRHSRVFTTVYGYSQNPEMTSGPGNVIIRQIFPDGEEVTYTYDLDGEQVTIRSTIGGVTTDILRDRKRNARGNVTRIELGNRTVTTSEYDESEDGDLGLIRLSTANASAQMLQDYHYDYDENGNVIETTDAVRADQSVTFKYDELDQLLEMVGPSNTTLEQYQYDNIGNLIRKGSVVQAYNAGGRPHALRSSGGTDYGYDANGNVISIGSTTIDWTEENMPATVRAGSLLIERSYVDETLWKKREQGVTTYYIPSMRVESAIARKYYGSYAERTEEGGRPQVRFYHPDHLGSSSVMTDADGRLIRRASYSPWGQDRGVQASVEDAGGNLIPAFVPNLQFNFKEKDAAGFYDYGARLYNPVTGRWLSPDSEVTDGRNRYAYTGNNPWTRVDPTGHSWWIAKGVPGARPEFFKIDQEVDTSKYVRFDQSEYAGDRTSLERWMYWVCSANCESDEPEGFWVALNQMKKEWRPFEGWNVGRGRANLWLGDKSEEFAAHNGFSDLDTINEMSLFMGAPGAARGFVMLTGRAAVRAGFGKAGGRVFWSGAREEAALLGQTLNDVPVGKAIEFADNMLVKLGVSQAARFKMMGPLWKAGSWGYAKTAEGTVYYVFKSKNEAVGYFFKNVEQPALIANPNVTTIVRIPITQ